jgi:hypothetical protein
MKSCIRENNKENKQIITFVTIQEHLKNFHLERKPGVRAVLNVLSLNILASLTKFDMGCTVKNKAKGGQHGL